MLHDKVLEDVNIFSTTNRCFAQHCELIYTRVTEWQYTCIQL